MHYGNHAVNLSDKLTRQSRPFPAGTRLGGNVYPFRDLKIAPTTPITPPVGAIFRSRPTPPSNEYAAKVDALPFLFPTRLRVNAYPFRDLKIAPTTP